MTNIEKTEDISDGYHTFWELYEHRNSVFIWLCKTISDIHNDMWTWMRVVRSKIHEDWLNVWEEWGMFLMVLHTEHWQISYHLDKKDWDLCNFADTELQAKIPFDWHTPEDSINRLRKL